MIAIVRHCRTLWEGHKIWNNLLPVLTKQLFLLCSIKTSGRFFQSFVALSEKLDFKNTNRQYHWNAFGWKIKQNNSTSIMISSHYALSLHGVISVLQLHTTLSKNHYNIFKFDSQKWYLLERSKSTYCTSGLNSRPRVMYYSFHMLKQGLLKIWTQHSLNLKKRNVGSGGTKITSQGLINYRFWLLHTELRMRHITYQVDWILQVHDHTT